MPLNINDLLQNSGDKISWDQIKDPPIILGSNDIYTTYAITKNEILDPIDINYSKDNYNFAFLVKDTVIDITSQVSSSSVSILKNIIQDIINNFYDKALVKISSNGRNYQVISLMTIDLVVYAVLAPYLTVTKAEDFKDYDPHLNFKILIIDMIENKMIIKEKEVF